MSKGGGGGTTVQYDQLPEYVQPYLERILETGEDKYIKPYTEYTGDRIADEAPQRDIVTKISIVRLKNWQVLARLILAKQWMARGESLGSTKSRRSLVRSQLKGTWTHS